MSQTPPPRLYDLVIVGASFAGLVAARTATMRGLKVAVLEAKSDAGHRVATTGILVKEAVDDIDIPHELTRRIHGVRLYAPSQRHVDLFAPGYFFLATDTAALLRWLAREAMRAGAHLLFNTRFSGATRDHGRFRFANLNIEARYLLGADGGRSSVARHLGLGRNARFLVGAEAEYDGLDADPRFLHCFIDSEVAPGYLGWVVPGVRHTQVGLAVSHGRSPSLNAFRAKTARHFQYEAARVVERRAGRIPCGGIVQPWAGPGVMLIGDAAGMVSPLTGGGIRLAFHFGRRAAQAIADHLLHLGPPPEVTVRQDLPRFAIKQGLRRAFDLAPPNALLNVALGTALARRIASHVYFHQRASHGVSRADFEAALARRAGVAAASLDPSAVAD